MLMSDDQLKELESLAAAFMSIQEIAIIMEIDYLTLRESLKDVESAAYRSHQKGYLKSKYEVNKKIINLAIAGSSPAQSQAHKLVISKELADDRE